jgi:YgiT-type zinc finger domain-containing protein
MRCSICNGETRVDKRPVTLEKDGEDVQFDQVLVEVCKECGEVYVDEETANLLLQNKVQNGKGSLR